MLLLPLSQLTMDELSETVSQNKLPSFQSWVFGPALRKELVCSDVGKHKTRLGKQP